MVTAHEHGFKSRRAALIALMADYTPTEHVPHHVIRHVTHYVTRNVTHYVTCYVTFYVTRHVTRQVRALFEPAEAEWAAAGDSRYGARTRAYAQKRVQILAHTRARTSTRTSTRT